MGDPVLDTRDRLAAEARLDAALAAHLEDPRLRRSIAAQLVEAFAESGPTDKRKPLIAGRFVIRDEDLRLLDTVAPVAITVATAIAAPTKATITASVAGTLVALVRLGRELFRSGSVLEPRETQVLAALKASATGLSDEELFERLTSGPAPIAEQFPTLQHVTDALARLETTRTRAKLVALVSKDNEGRWHPAGV